MKWTRSRGGAGRMLGGLGLMFVIGVAIVGILGLFGVACSPDLGQAPFKCNTGFPKCPDGYQCNPAHICVPEGTCPEGIPGCAVAPPPGCGDGNCNASDGETCKTCEKDCGKCQAGCGDGKCNSPSEDCKSCPADCGQCPPSCGDGKCEGNEKTTCPQDCSATTCGNGVCESGETVDNCPLDCKCGDGKCELPETEATCPSDCKPTGCTDGTTQCVGTDTLKFCDKGVWKTELCTSICTSGNYDYTTGCKLSTQSNKEVCICGKYATFGGICNATEKCQTGLTCVSFGSGATDGFCTKTCTNTGYSCPGAPLWTQATCAQDTVGGQHVCIFDCDFLTDCPKGLHCNDPIQGICMP